MDLHAVNRWSESTRKTKRMAIISITYKRNLIQVWMIQFLECL